MKTLEEKISEIGLDKMADSTRNKLAETDSILKQDNEDVNSLEDRYIELNLCNDDKMVIDDYIACLQSSWARFSDLSYMAGIKDTIALFSYLGLLNDEAAKNVLAERK